MKNNLFNTIIKASLSDDKKLTKTYFFDFLTAKRRLEKKEIENLWNEFKIEIVTLFSNKKGMITYQKFSDELNIHESLLRKSIEYYNKNFPEREMGFLYKTGSNMTKKNALNYINAKKLSKQESFPVLINAGYTFQETTQILGLELFFIHNGQINLLN